MKAYILLFFIIGATYGKPHWAQDLELGISEITSRIHSNIAQMQQNLRKEISKINHDVKETVENIQEELGKNGTKSVTITNIGGTSRSVVSGTTEDGETYFREIEDRVVGDLLYRIERVYNPKTKQIETTRTTLNLKDPNAKPVVLPNDDDIPAPQNGSDKNQQTQQNKQADSKEAKEIEKKAQ